MGLFIRAGSPYWWMRLKGRKRESTGILYDGASAAIRKALRAQAEDIFHARMAQIARGKVGLPIDSGTTFRPWSTWYEQHHTAKHRAAARERDILERLRAHFGAMTLTEIRPGRWTEYQTARLKDGISLNTVGRELAVMKAVLTAAVGEHIDVNPLANVKRVTKKIPPKRTISATEEKQLLEALAGGKVRGGSYGDPEMLDLYILGVGTLLRQSNLIALQRRHVHENRLVVETKTGPHVVALDGPTSLQRRCIAILKRRWPKTHNGYFFPKWQARFERDRNGANAKFLQGFRRACARAGIPWGLNNNGVVWHTATRASGATRMLRDYGIDIRTVQVIGGWSSLDQMAAYLGVDQHASAASSGWKIAAAGTSPRRGHRAVQYRSRA